MDMTDTIAAIASSIGDSGIGIIRISGNHAIDMADSIFMTKKGNRVLKNAKSHTIHYGYVIDCQDADRESGLIDKERIIDEVLVSVFRAPRSYTAEDTVEINCHGGTMIVKKVLKAVLHAGARLAQPGEFTKRAFFNGRIDLSEAEAVMDLIHSKNELARKTSVMQLRGDLSKKITGLREKLIYEIAFIESALDDPEHISLEGYPEELSQKLDEIIVQIQELLRTAESGRMVKDGISTVIVGKPNAGKSSLLNMILGQDRAIVTDIAGTTRDILEESYTFHDIHLNIIDTAGIRYTKDTVEKIGVDRAKKYAMDADLILYVIDSSVKLDDNDKEIFHFIKDKKIIFLFNKTDLEAKVTQEELMKLYDSTISENSGNSESFNHDIKNIEEMKIIHTSAVNGKGLSELEDMIEELMFSGNVKKNDEIMITNIRHKEALDHALQSLMLVKKSILDGMPEDFYTIDLMDVYASLGYIIGAEVGDDLVDEIFSKFCMGK